MPQSPTSRDPTVRSYVAVRPRPTVVRLDDRDADWIDDFHLTQDVARHVAALDATLSEPHGSGIFVIGPYGSGKSHLLAWLARRIGKGDDPPRVVAVSMLDHPSDQRLEAVIGVAAGVVPAGDRRPGWTAAAEGGLLLLIDELSEFLLQARHPSVQRGRPVSAVPRRGGAVRAADRRGRHAGAHRAHR